MSNHGKFYYDPETSTEYFQAFPAVNPVAATYGWTGESACWGNKHEWVDTGTKLIFCKKCNADGEFDQDGHIRVKTK